MMDAVENVVSMAVSAQLIGSKKLASLSWNASLAPGLRPLAYSRLGHLTHEGCQGTRTDCSLRGGQQRKTMLMENVNVMIG
jgi:hypothetical protein